MASSSGEGSAGIEHQLAALRSSQQSHDAVLAEVQATLLTTVPALLKEVRELKELASPRASSAVPQESSAPQRAPPKVVRRQSLMARGLFHPHHESDAEHAAREATRRQSRAQLMQRHQSVASLRKSVRAKPEELEVRRLEHCARRPQPYP